MARIKGLTEGFGAHSVVEAVGTQDSMMPAIRSVRAGGHVGYVGVAHGVELAGEELFYSHAHLHGGPACAGVPAAGGSLSGTAPAAGLVSGQ